MFTTPDQNDAVTPCPPFSPPGPLPEGFFADCNPGANFPGTRPIAEHFNELILNLRALLTKAGVAPVKGDPTMLWRAILQVPIITTPIVLRVMPGGTATPPNPIGGDPFDSLSSAMTWLGYYQIGPTGSVDIQLAGATFAMQPLRIAHPDGHRITIEGAGLTLTTLQFPTDAAGLTIAAPLNALRNLTIAGQSTVVATQPGAVTGLLGSDGVVLGNLTVSGFGGYGIALGAGGMGVYSGSVLTCQNNRAEGFSILGGNLNAGAAKLVASNNGGGSNIAVAGQLEADEISTTGGTRGLGLNGSSAQVSVRKLGVDACSLPDAVYATSGALLAAHASSLAGDWWTWNVAANTAQYFRASGYGYIATLNASGVSALASNNRGNTSPALNTVGNVQAYIQG